MRQIIIIIIGAAMLSACATPETRIRGALIDRGVSKTTAACMAERMAERLSLGQMLKIRKLEKFEKVEAGDISANEFVKYTRALQDPEIVSVTASAAVICSF